jgi:AAA domain
MKAARGRRGMGRFLDAFQEVDEQFLLAPDETTGRAGILSGHTVTGNPVLIKVWPRNRKGRDSDLEEIWRHELRQLHRLAGYPGAHDLIAQLVQSHADNQGFYLVLDPGQRRPLEIARRHGSAGHWLKQPRLAANRVQIWRNVKRISQAMEILHLQGLLHRNLDTWAILTAASDEPDFQLTGFEWSMRLASTHKAAKLGSKSSDSERYSFQHDWLLLGLLVADLLGVQRERLLNLRIAPFEIAEHIAAEEARLLRAIVHQESSQRGSAWVENQIDSVITSLGAEVAGVNPKTHIAMRIGAQTPLSARIRSASSDQIEMDDLDGQIEFVKNDLSESPLLLQLRPWNPSAPPRLILRGLHLYYRLDEYRHRRSPDSPTWEFAYCDSVEGQAPAPVNVVGQAVLEPSSIEILGLAKASESFPRLRGHLRSWEEVRRACFPAPSIRSREERVHRALTLTQFLEALYAAAEIFPVDIEQIPDEFPKDDEELLWLRPRAEPARDALSQALGLRPPSARLEVSLLGDNVSEEGWILTESPSLGNRTGHETEWEFQDLLVRPGAPPVFAFTGASFVPPITEAYLVPAGSVGRTVQFRRRIKALRALKDHIELLKELTDPRERILDSHEKLKEDELFALLDEPKQEALREAIGTLPLYLVQGPPGVGKTHLVRDIVRRRFSDEPHSRLLVSAQSNSAVDHLMEKLSDALRKEGPRLTPLIVRSRSRERAATDDSPFEIGTQARSIVEKVVNSELAKKASPRLVHRLRQLATSAARRRSPTELNGSVAIDAPAASNQAMRSFESLVVRSANVVFATTNSAELERLIDEKGQFDWSIGEEAGKATGAELLSPLLLSHRRLMIGDHKQLPPFGSEQMTELLKDPTSVQKALLVGEEFIGGSLRDPTTEEILDAIEEDDGDLPALCSDALRLFTLFEGLIEKEFEWQASGRRGKHIAKRLTMQHRMHPHIAQLVSRCFYEGDLDTDKKAPEGVRGKRADLSNNGCEARSYIADSHR